MLNSADLRGEMGVRIGFLFHSDLHCGDYFLDQFVECFSERHNALGDENLF